MQRITRPALLLVPIALLGACKSGDAGTTGPVAVASVTVSPAQVTVEVGASVQLSAQTRDANGNVLTGRAVSWSSSNPSIATVDGNGLVRGIAAGSVTITATSEGRSGNASAEVRNPPVSTVEIAPSPVAMQVGQAVQLTATARAANGTAIPGKTFAWNSTNAGIVQVTQAGLATGVSAGNASISATTDGITGNVAVNVTPQPPVVVTQITPATLVEGQPATITGSGFSATSAANAVRIDGVSATVTQATTTSLQITVPSFDCRPKRNAAVQISVGALTSNAVMHPVSPAAFVALALGELAIIQSPNDRCLQFDATPASERYIVGIQSVLETVTTLTPVTVTGGVPTGAITLPPLPAPAPRVQSPEEMGVQPIDAEQLERWQRHIAITAAAYERERPMYQRIADRMRALPALAAASVPSVPSTVMVGNQLTIRYPNIRGNSCTDFSNIMVTVRKVTSRAIFVEDTGNPVMLDQAVYDQAGTDFGTIYDIDVDHFGAPVDAFGNPLVVIVVTKEVNKVTSPPLGFVSGGDAFPLAQCPASNENFVFYMRSPDPTGMFAAGVYTVATLTRDFPTLLLHEFAHIIQATRRRAAGGPFMPSPVAEGLATAAQEVGGLQILGLQNGQNYGRIVVYPTLGADPRYFFSYIGDFLAYYGFNFSTGHNAGAPEECSWVGSTAVGGNPGPCAFASRVLYGLTWSLIKHIIDRHLGGAASQKQYTRAFSNYNGPSGLFAELVAVLGRPIASMMAEWAAMLHIDDRFATAPNFRLLNWNIRDVAAAWQTPNAELLPRMRGFAAFTDNFNVRAGSSGYYDISGSNRSATAIRFRDGAGDALPSHMQVWIVRVQ